MLRLQTKAGAALIDCSAFSLNGAVQEIAGIKLHPGLIAPHLQHPTAGGLFHTRLQSVGTKRFADDPVMVIAGAVLQYFVRIIDARTNGRRLAKIKRRAGHIDNFAGRDEVAIHRGGFIGIDVNDVTKNVTLALPRQVEIGMMREIANGRFVGRGGTLNFQLIILGQSVNGRHFQKTGETLIAIPAYMGENQNRTMRRRHRTRHPYNLVKTFQTAVQRVGTVVRRQRIGLPGQSKFCAANAVAITADERAKIGAVRQVTVQRVISEHDVRIFAMFVRHGQ